MTDKTLGSRFLAKIRFPLEPSKCWEWTGAIVDGYGRILANGEITTAHRVAFALFRSELVPGW